MSPEIDLLARAMSCERAILDDQEPETLEDKRIALEAAREFIEWYIPYQREMDGSSDSLRVLDEWEGETIKTIEVLKAEIEQMEGDEQ